MQTLTVRQGYVYMSGEVEIVTRDDGNMETQFQSKVIYICDAVAIPLLLLLLLLMICLTSLLARFCCGCERLSTDMLANAAEGKIPTLKP